MSNEWVVLNGIEDVARAKVEGWEIERRTLEGWKPWRGTDWCYAWGFRGRPRQPKEVTYECFDAEGTLIWRHPSLSVLAGWVRIPELDKTVTVK